MGQKPELAAVQRRTTETVEGPRRFDSSQASAMSGGRDQVDDGVTTWSSVTAEEVATPILPSGPSPSQETPVRTLAAAAEAAGARKEETQGVPKT